MAKDDAPIRPITLGNMRQNGVRGLFVKDGVGQFRGAHVAFTPS